METVLDIIAELGGVTAISNETGIPLTTVHSWKRARFVPSWRVPELVTLAERLGKRFTAADFPTKRPAPVIAGNNGEKAEADHADADSPVSAAAAPGKSNDLTASVPA